MNWQTFTAKAGETQKCIDACDELILWFSEGKYVTKGNGSENEVRAAVTVPADQIRASF